MWLMEGPKICLLKESLPIRNSRLQPRISTRYLRHCFAYTKEPIEQTWLIRNCWSLVQLLLVFYIHTLITRYACKYPVIKGGNLTLTLYSLFNFKTNAGVQRWKLKLYHCPNTTDPTLSQIPNEVVTVYMQYLFSKWDRVSRESKSGSQTHLLSGRFKVLGQCGTGVADIKSRMQTSLNSPVTVQAWIWRQNVWLDLKTTVH